jgi:hypothetical protein
MTQRAVLAALVLLPAIMPASSRDEGAGSGSAGDAEISVTADRTAATIGDPIELTVRLVVPAGAEVKSFAPDDRLAALNILDRSAEPAVELGDGRRAQVLRYRIAAYDLDGIEVPALQATVVGAGGEETTVASRPLSISIASVLSGEDSEPADIKSPVSMPVAPLWPWLLLAALLLAAGAWWLRRRRRTGGDEAAAVPEAPPRPAHLVAYGELERLLSSGLLERGGEKEFYIELAEILKRYLEARLGIDTFERTSNEILAALRSAGVSIKVKASAAEFFVACDVVKFARHHPAADETRATVERAYQIIDETKQVPAPAAASPAPLSGGPAVQESPS